MNWNPKDKLFVNPYGWNSKPSRKDEVVYIRKDAVLEWARNYIEILNADGNSPQHIAMVNVCEQVIDKLNSM